ncbi:hypothetical protein [Sinorhizobium alkalisoli]|uniref:Uncharacterized protein n=1 Tax=Sinorhizobium alkalisoli TaxID=1752398 RepID=A0A1E3VB40_9HYPH|nr:hypothetical protein [Sinorhizobium alkalisoli]MCA1492470.1 hypothetical protein [Ensifer sp. NBAIM29]ODR90627.1 hypothetical protein A8M32_15010 [Sinorhizobium alkalisoli]QFI67551.1 hypothetical protein EKH55_2677 [Sinorhizobium alkalisoli]
MADFVAVIRRTVDGLSENTPEMRARVYEKARGAVRRQLENMNPRPSDDMISRQLNKLETAIAEVDSEYAEALPAIEEPEAIEPAEQAPLVAASEPDTVPPPPAEPEQTMPAEPEQTPPEPQQEVATPAAAGAEAPSPAFEEVPHVTAEVAPESEPEAPAQQERQTEAETEAARAPVQRYEQPPAVEEEPDLTPATLPWSASAEEQAIEGGPIEDASAVDEIAEQQAEDRPHAEFLHEEGGQAELAPVEPTVADEEPLAASPKSAAPSEWALPEWDDSPTLPREAQPAPEPSVGPEIGEPERLGLHPVEPDGGEPSHAPEPGPVSEKEAASSWSFDDRDPFGAPTKKTEGVAEPEIPEWSWPVEKAATAAGEEERAGSAWDHIDDLLGFQDGDRAQNGASSAAKEEGTGVPPTAEPGPPVSYRATPKTSRFRIKGLAIAAVVLLLLGGGGYAYWINREVGNAWLSDMIAKIMPSDAESPAPAADGKSPASQPDGETGAEDGAVSPEPGSTKYTQRLLADGTERDEGPAGTSGADISQEGKSVAAQTEVGQQPKNDGASGQSAAATPAENGDQTAMPEVSIADGEKMFLYEERLGQSSPTAIPGAVSWSIKEESPGGDAKPEAAIQAQIVVPDRGLTALMTIKRNADPSLPASHVIEFVFSLPSNFEGGSIDGVQRVSMKRTEQDRGDPLIAVPAKITDDFHMIALNDFAEATKVNTELLRSRSWMDIPITYRNGRRALLTLEKGATGTDVFNEALQAWSALGSAAASGQ